MRYHHFLWHNIRENWLNLKAETQHAIAKLGWAPPRPALAYDSEGNQIIMDFNGSGEDFFYMHRQMIQQVNEMVAGTDYERVVGWKSCPYPGDPNWPVPPAYPTGDSGFDAEIVQMKSDAYFWSDIQPTDAMLWDHDYLRNVSLGTLGSHVQFTVHQWMHLRFSTLPELGIRPTPINPTPDIDPMWDNLTYNYLGDLYAAHVNPIFWKIHGWVDDHIEEWRKANGLDTIPWQYTWQNGPASTLTDLFAAGAIESDDEDPDADPNSDSEIDEEFNNMIQAAKIMIANGADQYFRNRVKSPFAGKI